MEQSDRPFPLDVPVPGTMQAALRQMVHRDFLASQKYQEQQWRAHREGAHPDIVEFERVFIKRMAKLGVPMFAHNMVRSFAEQEKLLADGVSKAGGGKSAHNFGLAVDIVHSIRAWNLTKPEWALVGHVGQELAKSKGIELSWGGNWPSFYDPAHWELTGWKRFAGQFRFPRLGG